jgi:glycosyltransferase involved in cell wall biosynthesis
MKNVAIVAPVHIQPSLAWEQALKATVERKEADVIIVDDSDGEVSLSSLFDVYDYSRQKEALGDELYAQFEQFHHSSACKNFGTWLAYKKGYEYIIVIDSDCIIPEGFVYDHMGELNVKGDGWSNPIDVGGMGFYSRGFPYSKRNQEKWAQ